MATPAAQELTLGHLQEEAMHHKRMRHNLTNAKLILISALVGVGGIRVIVGTSDLDLAYALYSAPFLAAFYDLFIFAEDYEVARVDAFVRRYRAQFSQWESLQNWQTWRSIYRESTARYYGSACISFLAIIPGLVAYFTGPDMPAPTETTMVVGWASWILVHWGILLWAAGSIFAVAFVFVISKSRYNVMVEEPAEVFCPVGGSIRKLWRFILRHYRGGHVHIIIVPVDKLYEVQEFESGDYCWWGRIPTKLAQEVGYIAMYQKDPRGIPVFAITHYAPATVELYGEDGTYEITPVHPAIPIKPIKFLSRPSTMMDAVAWYTTLGRLERASVKEKGLASILRNVESFV